MTRYDILLYLHVSSAIIWLGAGLLTIVLQERAFRSGDAGEVLRGFQDEGWLAPRLFIPAALSTLVLGVLLVIEGDWGFTTPWILIGLGGFATTFITGIAFLKPTGERIAEIISRDVRLSPAVVAEARRRLMVGRIDIAILFTVVFDMAVKPDGGEVVTLLVVLAILVTVAALSAGRGPRFSDIRPE
ncbi:MAG: DUF2269 family protein [Actinomycetota bacterium]